ncbi:WD40-repeat-containing domain protein [Halteromyces radiatus]|uniref:WD40-repeat-containing domain protein n=1 Tax=Halteromyces radiatus TaxID=101107 RepID=UPI00222119AF|nr:WD40-repeat-containing domain protein [Halteromyces radiatus]KAI8082758.1 WD40-repeat-containing domain protein [Halteromyces radiatus]
MDYRKTVIKKYPKTPTKLTSEGRYWKRFKSPILIKEYASIPSIYFSPVAPYDFAVASSTRVQIYSSKTHQPKKTISRFKDLAYSATFRHDGKLIVAGDATGLVQLFDINSRAILRTFREHTMPVHVTKFSNNTTNIMSASDDKTVRIWDIPTETSINVFEGHEDYIRAGVVNDDNPNLVITGSYDQTVKLWDMRENSCVMTMQHGAPVESLLMYPGGSAIVSAGGPTLKVWDLLSGGRCIHTLSNHQKTVTSLAFNGSHSRLLAGSLDHQVKVYDVQDYRVVHTMNYPAPVLSVGISPDDTHITVGMANGLLSIRQRQVSAEEKQARMQNQLFMQGGGHKYFMQNGSHHLSQPLTSTSQSSSASTNSYNTTSLGISSAGETLGKKKTPIKDDFTVEKTRRVHLAQYDKYLKKFEFTNALDESLKVANPNVVVSMLQELIHRDSLMPALTGRDDVSLEPLVRFLMRHIQNPKYTNILVDVSEIVLDIYYKLFGQSPLIDELILQLRQKVANEVKLQKDLLQTIASLDMLFARSTIGLPTPSIA